MVLMSFFIIYFEMKETAVAMPPALVMRPTAITQPKEVVKEPDEVVDEEDVSAIKIRAFDALAIKLKDESVTVTRDSDEQGVYVNLNDNIYGEGSYELNSKARKSVLRILNLIKPYTKEVELTFVGHADHIPISKKMIKDTKLLDSNFVLSSLRATKAMEFAAANGFDPRFILAQGSGEFARSVRSLSLRITSRRSQSKDVTK